MSDDKADARPTFSSAEMGAIAHLYRGEIYRSTIWRTRLDTTTNWSVVTLGVALSLTFSSPSASPLPLVLIGVLVLLFLMIETRRYRYFNVWRARCRWMEHNFYVPMLDPSRVPQADWRAVLAGDYRRARYHVSFMSAMGRRIRRNYLWIIVIQATAFIGKLLVHPAALHSIDEFFRRADIGPIPGEWVIVVGAIYVISLAAIALWSEVIDSRKWGRQTDVGDGMG